LTSSQDFFITQCRTSTRTGPVGAIERAAGENTAKKAGQARGSVRRGLFEQRAERVLFVSIH
jgi:hypothetical protein